MFTTVTTSSYCKYLVAIFPSQGVFYPLSLPVSLAMPECPTVYCHLALVNFVPCTVLPDPIPGTRAKTALKGLPSLSVFPEVFICPEFQPSSHLVVFLRTFPWTTDVFSLPSNVLHLLPQVPLYDPLELFNQMLKTLKRTTVSFPSLYFSQSEVYTRCSKLSRK